MKGTKKRKGGGKSYNSKAKITKNHNKNERKNVKFMQRGKQMETLHRKQKLLEDTWQKPKSFEMLAGDLRHSADDLDNQQEENMFESLLSKLSKDDFPHMDDDELMEPSTSSHKEDTHDDTSSEDSEEDEVQSSTLGDNTDTLSVCNENDDYSTHLDTVITSEIVDNLISKDAPGDNESIIEWRELGKLKIRIPQIPTLSEQTEKVNTFYTSCGTDKSKAFPLTKAEDLVKLHVKPNLVKNIPQPFTKLQFELLSILCKYNDVYYPERSFNNEEELRVVYCIHALNHMLKTRARIIHHNAKLEENSKKSSKSKAAFIPDNYRDQGLVRPKILMILPFRESACRIVKIMLQLLQSEKPSKKDKTSENYERFLSEYSGNTIRFPKTNPKSEDYEKTFSGNVDDNFRIGISITKKGIKLYSDFYSADIIMASPLGLRTVIGAKGSKDRDYDFLNSIEMLIVDQAEVLMAQNWENVLHVINHLHLPLQTLHDVNLQRVRSWCLNGFSKFYRQTIILSSHSLPEFFGILNNKCRNYRGRVCVSNPIKKGEIRNVLVSTSQIFQRIEVSDFGTLFDRRFEYFIHEVLPNFRSSSRSHCMIYIPSYFDYVRLRNYFKSETISCVQICEYTKQDKIARARDIFYHSGAHFLLYSERSHFFRRTRIKGIRNLIMYQPPTWPHFYSEIINLMHKDNQNANDGLESSMSVTVLYTKYDSMQLSGILGSEKAAELLESSKLTHAFTAEV